MYDPFNSIYLLIYLNVSGLRPEGYLAPAMIALFGERAESGAGIYHWRVRQFQLPAKYKAYGISRYEKVILPYLIDRTGGIESHDALTSGKPVHAGRRAHL